MFIDNELKEFFLSIDGIMFVGLEFEEKFIFIVFQFSSLEFEEKFIQNVEGESWILEIFVLLILRLVVIVMEEVVVS